MSVRLFDLMVKVILFTVVFFCAMLWNASASDCVVYLSKSRGHAYELEARRDGKPVGHMLYSIDGDSAHIGAIYIDPEHRGDGVSSELIGHMLARDPVIAVTALLVLDNFEASGLRFGSATSFEECVSAIKNTPLFKAISKFGFKNVLTCRHTPGTESIAIEVERKMSPTPNYF